MKKNAAFSATLVAWSLLAQANGFAPMPLEKAPRKGTLLKDIERPDRISPVKLIDWFSVGPEPHVSDQDVRVSDDWLVDEFNQVAEKVENPLSPADWFAFEQATAMETKNLFSPKPLSSVKPADHVDWFSLDLTSAPDKKLVKDDKVLMAGEARKKPMHAQDTEDFHKWIARRFKAPQASNKVEIRPKDRLDWFGMASQAAAEGEIRVRPNDKDQVSERTEIPLFPSDWFAVAQASATETNDMFTPKSLRGVLPTDHVDWFTLGLMNAPETELVDNGKVIIKGDTNWFAFASKELQSQKKPVPLAESEEVYKWFARKFKEPQRSNKVEIHPTDHLEWFAMASQAAEENGIQARDSRTDAQVDTTHADWFDFALFGN